MSVESEASNSQFPEDFGRSLLSATYDATSEGGPARLRVSIYRPYSTAEIQWWCSFRIFIDQSVVLHGSGPGTNRLSALYSCIVADSAGLRDLHASGRVTTFDSELWWVKHVLGDADWMIEHTEDD